MIDRIKRNTFFRRVLISVMQIMSIINRILPKNDRKILFYDSGRNSLEDNAEAFYSYLRMNGFDKKYKLLVCVPNERERNNYLEYKPIGIFRGIYEYLTSKYVLFSFGDFRIEPSKKQIVVNLWHGTPLKKIGKLSNDEFFKNEKIDTFTYCLAASDLFVPIMAKAFGCSVEKVKVLGHARNDYLFSNVDVLTKIGLEHKTFDKYILWMPTFRQSKDNRFVDSDYSDSETLLPILNDYDKLIKFDQELQVLNVLLVIKVHPYAKFKEVQLTNILMMKNEDILPKGVRLYEFVKEFDALITDYSSIYFDFMLLDRPIGFTLDDYKSYADNRGFVFDDAIDYMPGKHIYSEDEMLDFIVEIKNGLDKFENERRALLPKLCRYTDCNNCERLAEEIGIHL